MGLTHLPTFGPKKFMGFHGRQKNTVRPTDPPPPFRGKVLQSPLPSLPLENRPSPKISTGRWVFTLQS